MPARSHCGVLLGNRHIFPCARSHSKCKLDVTVQTLSAACSHNGTHLEYKYVVRESDGTVVAWKPGDNCYVRIPLSEEEEVVPERVSISDAWDGSSRDVQVCGA